MTGRRWVRVMGVAVAALMCLAADGSWLQRVPDADRRRVNPFAGQGDAIAAGGRMFDDHCVKCHGEDALGHGSGQVCGATACSTRRTGRFSGC